eukprot:03612.XXX_27430_27744_1 [CDS] Oithona nana genome sequencing.
MNEAIVVVQPKTLLVPNEENTAEKVKKELEKSKESTSGGGGGGNGYSGGHDWTCWPLCIQGKNDGNDDCCKCDDDCCPEPDCDCGDCDLDCGGGGGGDCDCTIL